MSKKFHTLYFLLIVAVVWGLYIYCFIKNPINALLSVVAPVIFSVVFIVTAFGLWGKLLSKLGKSNHAYFEAERKAQINNGAYEPITKIFSTEQPWYAKLFTFFFMAIGATGVILYFTIELPPEMFILPIMGAFFFFGGSIAFCSTIFSEQVMQRIVPILFGFCFISAGAFPYAIMNDINLKGEKPLNLLGFFVESPWATLFIGFAMLGLYLVILGVYNLYKSRKNK